ncbi:MAG: hypothetical protein JO307_28695 [Bryobacterales bacterium]|nr:hypothetical protein [Bryobacterales bacterium]MBV9400594.1 hypothetical protein [Bryobacterales bacterium]
MQQVADCLFVPSLSPGTVINVETRNRPYRIECISGDAVRISGHPSVCPVPLEMTLEGSTRDNDHLEPGFIGKGMHLVFGRPEEGLHVTTSEIVSIEVNGN